MKRTPQQDGKFRLVAADVAAEHDRRYALSVLTVCGLCEDFEHFGDPEDGKRAFLEHRNTTHPAAVDRGLKARRRAARDNSR